LTDFCGIDDRDQLVQVMLEITLLIGVPTDLTVNQSGRAQAAPSNPTASAQPVCLRVQLLSGNRIHAGNGKAFRSLTARGGGFAWIKIIPFDSCPL